MPVFDVQVKRTQKFTVQVTATDATAAAAAAKQMVKDGNVQSYADQLDVRGQQVDPDSLPALP